MPAVALVTGGNRGIGLGITQRLLADGFSVSILATREEPTELLESLDAPGQGALRARLGGRARGPRPVRRRRGRGLGSARSAGQQRRRRSERAGRPARGRPRELRPGARHQPARPVLPDPDVRQPRDRARPPTRPPAGHGDQRVEHLRHDRLDQPRRLLHLQGGRRHGHPAVGGAPGARGHRRLRGPARRDRHRHDRRCHREVRRPVRRRARAHQPLGPTGRRRRRRRPSWRPAQTPYSTGEVFHVDGGMHIPVL